MMLAVLPRQNSDEITGELFVEAYTRQLGNWPQSAISYLVDQATRQCRWFPTIAECLDILSGWRRHDADTMRKARASQLHSQEMAARRPPPPALDKAWQPTLDEIEAIKRQAADSLRA
jgi:hypothetical protein